MEHLLDANLALLQVLLLMGVVFALTRKRNPAKVAARSPEHVVARRETLLLLGYGLLALAAGFVLPRMFGWHPFGLHLAGTIFGTHDHVGVAEALTWAAYNLIVYAAIPLIIFRRRYSPTELNLRSVDRKNDTIVIVVVLAIESVFQFLVAGPEIVDSNRPPSEGERWIAGTGSRRDAHPAVRLASVSKTYRGASPVHALRNVSVTFASGSSRAVMGPSGSGKSTFLHCASGLDLQ